MNPRIKPQAKRKLLICSFRIDTKTQDELSAYAEFTSSDRSHVIRESLRLLFQSDRTFQSYLRERNRTSMLLKRAVSFSNPVAESGIAPDGEGRGAI